MRVLLIEDDTTTAKSIETMLKKEGLAVDTTSFGQYGLEVGKIYDYDGIILDLLLPDIEGIEVIKKLRASNIKTPVIVLSGLSECKDKVSCLNIGADDYVTKPFEGRELVSRVRAVIRRSKGHAESIIRVGRITINLQSRRVEVDGKILRLTGKEYSILELLCLRKGATLTKDMFLNHLYGGMDEPELKIIDVFVCKLRKKLMEALDGECYIETIWGRGYTLKDPRGPDDERLASNSNNSYSDDAHPAPVDNF
ncbi:MAG: response regulator transcription factor [Holosporaceae bacterium]|jgi:two-component system cell cycle response regulator CtrA|nr:response regulator transcription factor [Holosporaceae bacterium]